jgi:putative hydrolase of HD superfamily
MNKEKLLEFLLLVGKLKETERAGWIRKHVKNPESVSDHSFRVILLLYILADEFNLNKDKLIKMALIHDLAECITGDTTPHDGISKKEQRKRERKALLKLSTLIKNKEMIDLWDELEKQKSKESRFLEQIDKLEGVLQAYEYNIRNLRFLMIFPFNRSLHLQDFVS